MFQNGMSEEVQNYFVQGDEGSKQFHHPAGGDSQGLFRSQFVDPRAQMMGQHFPQFPYMGTAAGMITPHKMPNGDWLQSRNQLQLQQQQQQHHHHQQQQHQQHFFEPVQPPQHQQQQHFDQASFQALQMEKLRQQQQHHQQQQQELLLGHGFGIQQQQMMRPQMMNDNNFINVHRNAPMQTSPVYGLTNNNNNSPFGIQQQQQQQQQVGNKSLSMFGNPGLQSESDAIDNLHDLFGGVEKLFADDPVQESKSAITGLGSLGASLINGCEAELFGDGGSPFFGRSSSSSSVQYPFKQTPSGFQSENQMDHHGGFSQFQGPATRMQQQMTPPPLHVNEGHFQQSFTPGIGQGMGMIQQPQQQQQQSLGRVELQPGIQPGERWQSGKTPGDNLHGNFLSQQQSNNQMARGTLQLFKDLDDGDQSGFQSNPMVEQGPKRGESQQQESFRPVGTGFSLGMLDGHHQKSESTQVNRFQQPDAGLWLKDSNPGFSSSTGSGGEPVREMSRLQPDRLLLDSSKQHQSKEVQNLLSFGSSGPNLINPGSESLRAHQNEPSLRSRAYFDALEQQKQQTLHDAAAASQQGLQSYGNGGTGFAQAPGSGGGDISGLPWNVAGARQAQAHQAQQEAMQRGGSTESPVSFKPPVPKPVFGSPVLQNDKPSPLEATKRREDLFLNSGTVASTSSSSTPIMDGGSFASDKKSGSQVSEKLESEPSDRRTPSIWPQLSQQQQQQQNSHLSSGMVSSFQDINRRHFLPKNDLRANVTSRPESGGLFPSPQVAVKEKEDLMAPKVFESSALSSSSTGAKPVTGSTPTPIPVPFHQDKSQLLQSHLSSLARVSSSDLQQRLASREFSVPPSSSFTPPQHKPAESDSINDIVQLQHQPRVGPPALQLPSSSGSAPQLPGPASQLPGTAPQLPGSGAQLPVPAPPVTGSAPQLPGPAPQVPPQLPASKPEQSSGIGAPSMQQQSTSDPKAPAPEEKIPAGTGASERRDEPTAPENAPAGSLTTPEKPGNPVTPSLSMLQSQQYQQMVSQQVASLLGITGSGGLSAANLAALAHAKLAANQQILQVPKELQPLDLQQKLAQAAHAAQASQASQVAQVAQVAQVSLHQQRVQAALQAYSLAKSGLQMNQASASDQSAAAGSSTLPARSEALLQVAVQAAQSSASASLVAPQAQAPGAAAAAGVGVQQQEALKQLMLSTALGNSVSLPKKRKIEVQPLIPWRTTISQVTGALPPIRPADLQWAIETNRLPEKDVDEEFFSHDENMQFVGRARQRLKLTTHLMQHSLPPVPAAIMQSNTLDDRDSAMYVLARLSLGDACRMAGSEPGSKATLAATSELIVEGFKERMKLLEKTLQRLESLPLSLEFVKNTQYLDKVCVTNRLMRCHQELFPVNFTSQRRIQPVQRSCPQPLISALPIPDTFPEEFQLISL